MYLSNSHLCCALSPAMTSTESRWGAESAQLFSSTAKPHLSRTKPHRILGEPLNTPGFSKAQEPCNPRHSWMGQVRSPRYLQGCRARVLPADGIAVVGPHDLVDPVALHWQRLLWWHHTQFFQLEFDICINSVPKVKVILTIRVW